ncbi:hypothetical protein NFI08_20110 [Halomonas sp. EF61]|uniref:hypothetical protein n=1 Tax=Halomonas sp. EF61 TaxID=2950869 RepID=UPI0032DE32B3
MFFLRLIPGCIRYKNIKIQHQSQRLATKRLAHRKKDAEKQDNDKQGTEKQDAEKQAAKKTAENASTFATHGICESDFSHYSSHLHAHIHDDPKKSRPFAQNNAATFQ